MVTNIFDFSDTALFALSLLQDGEESDGGITRCTSHWGNVIRDNYGWNHLDEVNQMWGMRGLFSSNPNSVYRNHANRLKNLGL